MIIRNHLNLICEPSIEIPSGQIQNFGTQSLLAFDLHYGYTDTIRELRYVLFYFNFKGKNLIAW